MALNDYRLELDPPGYYRPVEPGLDWEVHGDELARGMSGKPPFLKPGDQLYLIPDTQWLVPRPRQFDPGWFKHADLAEQVIYKDLWAFAPELNVVESDYTATPGAGFPANKWLGFSMPAGGLSSPALLNVNLLNLFAACKLANPPVGVQVVGRTRGLYQAYQTPYLERLQYPEPHDFLLFGFGNLAFLIYHGFSFLLLTEDFGGGSYQNWRMLATFNPNQIGTLTSSGVTTVHNATHGGPPTTVKGVATSQPIAFLEAGFYHLAIGMERAMHLAQLQDPIHGDPKPRALEGGPMWLACQPRQKMNLQVQVMRYHTAEHARVSDPTDQSAVFIDLADAGSGDDGYRPTQPVQLWVGGKMDRNKVNGLTYTELLSDDGGDGEFSGFKLKEELTGQEFEVQAVNQPDNAPWLSDGTHGELAIHLKLTPGSVPGIARSAVATGYNSCVAPQLRLIQVKFDPLLVPRNHSVTYLNEDQWHSVEFELSLRDPNSKRVTFNLTDVGVSVLEVAKKSYRSDYPIHLTRDVDGDNSFSKLCLVAWVRESSYEEHIFQGENPDDEIRVWSLSCVGLMSILEDSPWRYLGMLSDPLNRGVIEHTTVARTVLKSAGFNVDDEAKVVINDDPGPPDVRQLPGAPGDDDGVAGKRQESPYQPEWDEGKGGYLDRIARLWRGWLVYELCPGTIVYGEDLVNVIIDDCQLVESELQVFYTRKRAADAGYPGQVYHEGETEYLAPESNFVRVMGLGLDGEPAPHVLDYDVESVTGDPDLVYNFMGDYVRPITLAPKMALGEHAQRQIARMVLNHVRLRRETKKKGLPGQMPWDMLRYDAGDQGLDVGTVLDLDGYEGKQWLVTHLSGAMGCRGIGTSVAALEWLPTPPDEPEAVGG